eukprot:TRINITY_DN2664_c0_g1_i1.p1 TRINITY_DN2664_c0_g1~~TRINITY_DN2664_c0_g1_i1.p1  ORF type:complete len:171 (-),score=15.72 TRINITY_DN2664_c0_g1_i1:42-554(-)
MDEPFYGEINLCLRLRWVILVTSLLLVIASTALSIVYGLRTYYNHLVMGGLQLTLFLLFIILFSWYLKGDLEKKFRNLLIFTGFVFIFGFVVLLLYAIELPNPKVREPSSECHGDNFYRWDSKQCVYITDWEVCKSPGGCLRWTVPGKSGACVIERYCVPENSPTSNSPI